MNKNICIYLATTLLCTSPSVAFDETYLQQLKDLKQCEGSDLTGANLRDADLTGAYLCWAELFGAKFGGDTWIDGRFCKLGSSQYCVTDWEMGEEGYGEP